MITVLLNGLVVGAIILSPLLVPRTWPIAAKHLLEKWRLY